MPRTNSGTTLSRARISIHDATALALETQSNRIGEWNPAGMVLCAFGGPLLISVHC